MPVLGCFWETAGTTQPKRSERLPEAPEDNMEGKFWPAASWRL